MIDPSRERVPFDAGLSGFGLGSPKSSQRTFVPNRAAAEKPVLRSAAIVWVVLLCGIATSAGAADFEFGRQTLTVPDGYVVEQVAAHPIVDRPINMAFDESGVLYVTDSSGANERPVQQLSNPTHRVLRLMDKDGDGRFESHTVFVDKLPFPEGTMWLDGSLYVAAPPVIWKFTDVDGDGVADRKEVWFDGGTVTGCANDLHGPYAGPDGYVYWCKGAFAEQRHQLENRGDFVTRASHVFRARPDGSGREVVLTGGMDNPVGLAFSPTGERFLSGTFFVKPGDGLRDGILHGVYGGVWGKEHGVLEGHPRTGELMPIMSHMGPAAATGLEMLRGEGVGMKGALLCAQFNLRKVSAHRLSPSGGTFRSADSDFLVSNDADFHPTDVVEDADGSVLVADTGGWYKICCPTSKELKPEVLGAIYRISKKGAPRLKDPRGLVLDWTAVSSADLVPRLSDARHEVAARAVRLLARRDAVGELSNVATRDPSSTARTNALWSLIRIRSESARTAIRAALGDKDESVRSLAIYGAGLLRDRGAVGALRGMLASELPQHARGAAEALGRLMDKGSVESLVRNAPAERFGFHATAYALYEIGDTVALSQMSGVPSGGAGADVVKTALAMLALPKAPSVPALPLVQPAAPVDAALRQAQLARIHELLASLKGGDAKKGAEMFVGQKANCALCHAVAGTGGVLGPDLTKIGAIRTATDLMEAVVYPSASYVRSYEPLTVRLKSGEEHYGIIRDETQEALRLATSPATEVSLNRSQIFGMTEGTMSLMPPGFDGVLTSKELADLVAYLMTLR
jgi:putative membrane-bound dehydrogenase-like protein